MWWYFHSFVLWSKGLVKVCVSLYVYGWVWMCTCVRQTMDGYDWLWTGKTDYACIWLHVVGTYVCFSNRNGKRKEKKKSKRILVSQNIQLNIVKNSACVELLLAYNPTTYNIKICLCFYFMPNKFLHFCTERLKLYIVPYILLICFSIYTFLSHNFQ